MPDSSCPSTGARRSSPPAATAVATPTPPPPDGAARRPQPPPAARPTAPPSSSSGGGGPAGVRPARPRLLPVASTFPRRRPPSPTTTTSPPPRPPPRSPSPSPATAPSPIPPPSPIPSAASSPPLWIPPPHTPPPSASSPPAAAPRSAPRCARSPGITRLQTPREHGAWTKASAGGGTLTRADDSSERKHSSSRTASERLHDDGLWPATIASRIPGDCCAPIWSGNLAGAVPTLPAWYFAFSFCFDAGAGRCGKRRWLRCHGVLCISERKWTRGHARHNDGLRRACEVHC